MSKSKRLAFIAVGAVMAGSMAISMAACGGGNTNYNPNTEGLEAGFVPTFDENGKLSYAAGTTLRMNVGNQNSSHPAHITYQAEELTSTTTMPDGKTYNAGDLKPAWQALSDELSINFADVFQNRSGDEQISTAIAQNEMGNYDIITASASAMTQNTSQLVNLTQYLDYMPNYKAFLEANPAIYYSLTSNTTNGAMYYAPYFDGLNDIEKYALAEKTWVDSILNASDAELATATTTFAHQGELKGLTTTSASAESYMGTTGSWEVDTTSADGTSVVKAKVDYSAALTAVQSATADLGKAYQAAAGSAYTGNSGNIVDIMNAAINATNGAVTGGQLAKILQEYIDVAYTLDGVAYTDRADVFNSVSGCWDVDLLVALSRCAVTCGSLIGADTDAKVANIYGVSGRQGTTQRRVDLTAFAGELYGVRGLESRYEYTYINEDGDLVDARQNAESYTLVARLGTLSKEGLLYTGDNNVKANRDFSDGGPSTLFMHDYSQTQTTAGFTDNEFNVAPIVTPVSKWDTDDDGSHETTMRFTESWRSVKNTGFCISRQGVQNNPDRLSAALAFIDYLFSNDGQILMTYGAMSTTGNENPNGWWYATEADVALDAVAEQVSSTTSDGQTNVSDQWAIKPEYEGQYFVYKNVVYNGMVDYSRAIPAITDANMSLFRGEEVNGFQQNRNTSINAINNYTNYARWVVGTTLPIGNKDQGFEYQCTADCALEGAAIVSAAVANGTIKHVKLSLAEGESMWYLIAPTSLALTTAQQSELSGAQQTLISGTYFLNSSKTTQRTNIYIDLIFYGFDTTKYMCGSETNGYMLASGEAYVTFLNNAGLNTRTSIFDVCWDRTRTYFGIGE